MDDFRKGKFCYLVVIDVVVRGIDIDNIIYVINYDILFEKESYVYCIGRMGWVGNSGKVIIFIILYENRFLEEIEEYIGFEILKVIGFLKEEVMKEKVVFEEKLYVKLIIKKDKNVDINKGIMKLYFNGGKKKKIRVVDFVGIIVKIKGVIVEDIGIIMI